MASTRSSTGRPPNTVGGGTATLSHHRITDGRADLRIEVRCLRPLRAECTAPLRALLRAVLPRDDLLTCRGAPWSIRKGSLNFVMLSILGTLLADEDLVLNDRLQRGLAAASADGRRQRRCRTRAPLEVCRLVSCPSPCSAEL